MADQERLEKILHRLEATTARLELLSAQKPPLAPKPGASGGDSPAPGLLWFIFFLWIWSVCPQEQALKLRRVRVKHGFFLFRT
uniref:SNAPC5 n=1 Tax=Steinernema glaseri TaxID=37863 RepID=A0A1I7YYS9_9BILA